MTADDWARVRDVFDAALALDAADRAAFLDRECAGRADLRTEVASLLSAHDASTGFMESPVYAVAPALFEDAPGPSLAGAHIGPYLIRHEIGRGGMGIVYLADDTRLSRRVALKAINPDVRSERARQRLRQEAQAAAALSHAGIATVYALEEIDGEIYLAAEYVAGPTLRALIDQGPIAIDVVHEIAVQLARALAAAHAQGVVHRDLKPENVVRVASGAVKVLDFGVARFAHAGEVRLTIGDAPVGTAAYMSPEQVRNEETDFRTDLFSLGVLTYELATGSNPFDGGTISASIARVLEMEPPPLSSVAGGRAFGLDRIVRLCLQKGRDDRYQSTMALVHDLEASQRACSESRTAPTTHDVPGSVHSASRASARWWWKWHQAVVSIVYALMVYPFWHTRLWMAKPWNMLLFLVFLGAAATAATVRLHLLFSSGSYPSELTAQRARALPWTRASDAAIVITLLAAALVVGGDHQLIAMLLVTVAAASTVSTLIIEPATTRAAFGDERRRT